MNVYLGQRLRSALPPEALALLERAARIASHSGWSIFLVGGYVRDILLKIPDYDVDVSVVGDALPLAESLARDTGKPLITHGRFGTAQLELGNGLHLDIVTARRESYPSPGALPVVEHGFIQDDLARRDFTINAMAVPLLPSHIGHLLDPHGGAQDIRARLIRVLHSASFRDDPTRIFRAVKLSVRLDFEIEQGTHKLILQALRDKALATVSTDRIVHELLLIMEEPRGDAMLAVLDKLGVLAAAHPRLSWPYLPGQMRPAEDGGLSAEARRNTYLAIVGAEFAAEPEEAASLARALHLPAHLANLMLDAARLARVWPQLGQAGQTPAETYDLLHGLDEKALEAYERIETLSTDSPAWERLHRYLGELRHVRPELTGDYLRSLQTPPGPHYKQVLHALLRARLNGQVKNKAEEERFVSEWLRNEGFLVQDNPKQSLMNGIDKRPKDGVEN